MVQEQGFGLFLEVIFLKHLLDLQGKGSMVQQTIERILPLTKPEQIIVVTEQSHAKKLIEQLPNIPKKNIIIEPERRDTTAALTLGAAHIHKKNPEAIMVALPPQITTLKIQKNLTQFYLKLSKLLPTKIFL